MHAGHILIEDSEVYYVPAASLPALRWHADQQSFRALADREKKNNNSSSDDNGEAVMSAALRERVAHAMAHRKAATTTTTAAASHDSNTQYTSPDTSSVRGASRWRDKVASLGTLARLVEESEDDDRPESSCIACKALYGVLPIGPGNAVLLYVTATLPMCDLTLASQRHTVYLVRGLDWLRLPSREALCKSERGRKQRAHGGWSHRRQTRSATAKPSSSQSTSEEEEDDASRKTRRRGEGEEDEDNDDESGSLPEATVLDYLAVVDRFCRDMSCATEEPKGRSYTMRRSSSRRKNKKDSAMIRPAIVQQMTGIADYDALLATTESSHLYFSPTLNLALSPRELMQSAVMSLEECSCKGDEGQEGEVHTASTPTSTTTTAATPLSSVSVFQWNCMLLEAFQLPTPRELAQWAAIQEKQEKEGDSSVSEKAMLWHTVRMPPADTSSLADMQMSHEEQAEEKAETTEAAASAAAASRHLFCTSMLYLPCYMRGLVQRCTPLQNDNDNSTYSCAMTLVTRLSCRWAGTRYCRRGLEPCGSGVCANLAITSLWLSHCIAGSDHTSVSSDDDGGGGSVQGRCRVAVYELVRGSVPRRWQQPADLSFKPAISFTTHTSAAMEELGGHVALLHRVLPGLRQLCLLDTTSASSRLERPLAAGLMHAVHGLQAKQTPSNSATNNSECSSSTSAQLTRSLGTSHNQPSHSVCLSSSQPSSSSFPVLQPSLQYVKFDVGHRMKRAAYEVVQGQLRAVLQRSACAGQYDEEEEEGKTEGANDAAHESRALVARLPWHSFTRCETDRTARGVWRICEAQSAYVRVNCLDCLDRTNLVQCMLAEMVLPSMLHYVLGESPSEATRVQRDVGQALRDQVREVFALQGIVLSHMYAESEPHFLPYLLPQHGQGRWRRSVRLHQAGIALRRWYHQNFTDGRKQDAIALLTRQHEPALFNSVVESPFSRDLTSMNREVLYGLLLALAALGMSLALACVIAEKHERRLHVGLACGWLIYFAVLGPRLMHYRLTYPNRSLLPYGRAENVA